MPETFPRDDDTSPVAQICALLGLPYPTDADPLVRELHDQFWALDVSDASATDPHPPVPSLGRLLKRWAAEWARLDAEAAVEMLTARMDGLALASRAGRCRPVDGGLAVEDALAVLGGWLREVRAALPPAPAVPETTPPDAEAHGAVDSLSGEPLPPLSGEQALDLALVAFQTDDGGFAAVRDGARRAARERLRAFEGGVSDLRRLVDDWDAGTSPMAALHEQRRRRCDHYGRALRRVLLNARDAAKGAPPAWWPTLAVRVGHDAAGPLVVRVSPDASWPGSSLAVATPSAAEFDVVSAETAEAVLAEWRHDKRLLVEMDAWQDAVRTALERLECGLPLLDGEGAPAPPKPKPERRIGLGERQADQYARNARPYIDQAKNLAHAQALGLAGTLSRLDEQRLVHLRSEAGKGECKAVAKAWREAGYQPKTGTDAEKLDGLKSAVKRAVDDGAWPEPST